MKTTKIYAIIGILMMFLTILMLKTGNIPTEVIVATLITSVLIEFCGIYLITWLLKHYTHSTVVLLCTGITMFLVAVILFVVWLTTHVISDVCLTLSILLGLTAFVIVILSQLIRFIMYIKRNLNSKKNEQ